MTTDQILFGVGLTFVLAVGSQVIAALLRIPALILLLPAGFIAGAATDDIHPDRLLGPAFQPLVSLAVALILYEAGLGLDPRKIRAENRRLVIRLIVLGVGLSWATVGLLAVPLLGMSANAAAMLGAILVVSGPTVVGPLLDFVRPTYRLRGILTWEGSLVDPIGGLLGSVVFQVVLNSAHRGFGDVVPQFLASVGVGLLGGVVGPCASSLRAPGSCRTTTARLNRLPASLPLPTSAAPAESPSTTSSRRPMPGIPACGRRIRRRRAGRRSPISRTTRAGPNYGRCRLSRTARRETSDRTSGCPTTWAPVRLRQGMDHGEVPVGAEHPHRPCSGKTVL